MRLIFDDLHSTGIF
ncbi:MAG: hypothetical protein L0209_00040, partial [candidate division Zixibacteria bacterium]|nr:hypothetical protein [candidate division Zixibacteria bacterium]